MTVVYVLIYWLVSAFLLLLPEIFGRKKRLTWKDWVPTFILAPLIFPFFLIMEKHGEASFGLGHKDEPTKKKKKR
jgi:hypothetical protein